MEDNTLTTLSLPWQGHSGEEVEAIIKDSINSKVGVLFEYQTTKTSIVNGVSYEEDAYYILGFKDEDAKEKWQRAGANVEDTEYILTKAEIPVYESGYSISILKLGEVQRAHATDDFTIPLMAKYTFAQGNNDPLDVRDYVTLTISASTNGIDWSTRKILSVISNEEQRISMKGLLMSSETVFVRIIANAGGKVSIPAIYEFSIYNLELLWNTVLNAKQRYTTDDEVLLLFIQTGIGAKTLHVEITHDGTTEGANNSDLDKEIGALDNLNYVWRHQPRQNSILRREGLFSVNNTYLYANDIGSDEVISSNRVTAEFIIGINVPSIAINNKINTLINYSSAALFDWNVNTAGTYTFKLMVPNEDTTVEYFVGSKTITLDSLFSNLKLATIISIDSLSQSKIENAELVVEKDGVLFRNGLFFTLENSDYFKPTKDPDFVLAPILMSNDDVIEGQSTIINPASQNNTTATYEGFDFLSDGWCIIESDNNSIPALKVPAKRKVTIDYNPFENYIQHADADCAFDIDFKCYNIIDVDEPILTITKDNSTSLDSSDGLIIYPDHAVFKTSGSAMYTVYWAESIKTHFGLTIALHENGQGKYFYKFYINGVLLKEFVETGATISNSNTKTIIGNNTSDIEVYGIRYYGYALDSREILLDYISSVPSSEEKERIYKANSIYKSTGISLDDVYGKYNVIIHEGHLFNFVNADHDSSQNNINLEIRFALDDPSGNSIKLKNLKNKGQGTTAMGYYWWNQSYSFTDDTVAYAIDDEDESRPLDLKGYAITNGEPLAKKLVGKINFASSMQSHKLGLTWAYTDVYKQMYKNGYFPNLPGQIESNERLAVYQKPFLFFLKLTEPETIDGKYYDTNTVFFRGLMTFGAGKGDKPTFGYNSKTKDTFFMVEGSDNNAPLALFNTVWDSSITYNATEETFDQHNTIESLDFGFGNEDYLNSSDLDDNPNNPLKALKEFFNFVYEHSLNIETAGSNPNLYPAGDSNSKQRIVCGTGPISAGSSISVMRWNMKNSSEAGLGAWIPYMNLTELYKDYCLDLKNDKDYFDTYGEDYPNEVLSAVGPEELLQKVKKIRLRHFRYIAKKRITKTVNGKDVLAYPYFNLEDVLYHYCFIKLFAGTDNRAKNTYYYTDPKTLEIRQMLDDLDTTIKTNNIGENVKPYWVEEHTKGYMTEEGNYWTAENSGFYTLIELAFNRELKVCMQSMLNAMKDLAPATNNTIMGFMEKYLLSTQDYFPEMAYNEMARCVYETAYNSGSWTTNPLTLSNGSQRWSEYQWLKDRIMYISSWCTAGEFGRGSLEGDLAWRAAAKHPHTFRVKSAKYLYPAVILGESSFSLGSYIVPDGVTVHELLKVETQTDDTLGLRGLNYYWEVGDMQLAIASGESKAFNFKGDRLRKIEVNAERLYNGITPLAADFNVLKVEISANNIEELIIHDAIEINSSLDLSQCLRLQTISLLGCYKLPSIILPESGVLTTIKLPANLESLRLKNIPNLQTLQLEGWSLLKEVYIENINMNTDLGNCISVITSGDGNQLVTSDINNLILSILSDANNLLSVTIKNLKNLTISPQQAENILNLGDKVYLTGTINLSDSVTFNLQLRLYYYLLSIGSDLVINYPNNSFSGEIKIGGLGNWNFPYCGSTGEYELTLVSKSNGTFTRVDWSVNNTTYALINEFGVLNVHTYPTATDVSVQVTAKIYNGTLKLDEETIRIYLYDRHTAEGDYVYADKTYSPSNNLNYAKEDLIVGRCFYADYLHYDPPLRLVCPLLPIAWSDSAVNLSMRFGPYPATQEGETPVNSIAYCNLVIHESEEETDGIHEYVYVAPDSYGDIKETDFYGYDNKYMLAGHHHTLAFIRQRDTVLSLESSVKSINKLLDENPGTPEYQIIYSYAGRGDSEQKRLYYPPVSYCWAYVPHKILRDGKIYKCVPIVDENDETFGKHKWWLPTRYELYVACTYITPRSNDISANSIGLFWVSEEKRNGGLEIYVSHFNVEEKDNSGEYRYIVSHVGWIAGNSSYTYDVTLPTDKKSVYGIILPICKF